MTIPDAARWRSLLFVPGDRPDRFAKAAASGADAIIIDLEDAVADGRKAEARAATCAWLAGPDREGGDREGPERRGVATIVRINSAGHAGFESDLQAMAQYRPDAVMLPKTENAKDLQAASAIGGSAMGQCLIPLIESPRGILAADEIAAGAVRPLALCWGIEDLCAGTGALTAREGDGGYTPAFAWARSQLLFAAAAAGLPVFETVFADTGDETGLARIADDAARDGFAGMLAIHPRQVPIIHDGFRPSPERLEWARKVQSAVGQGDGAGAAVVDGRMVDAVHLKIAQRLIAAR
ncbi:CoA ester lyase [Croceicoccus sp. Ery5]|uniref:HpcH/HpaI aldolase/citrate lyase family protein n=1 Tax=Croceicoccus sp. Ery5 TaxID=1703340 RepID=UPI001E49313B|nr:CoA ester lyase [Croceicoccus sp. Ery5]